MRFLEACLKRRCASGRRRRCSPARSVRDGEWDGVPIEGRNPAPDRQRLHPSRPRGVRLRRPLRPRPVDHWRRRRGLVVQPLQPRSPGLPGHGPGAVRRQGGAGGPPAGPRGAAARAGPEPLPSPSPTGSTTSRCGSASARASRSATRASPARCRRRSWPRTRGRARRSVRRRRGRAAPSRASSCAAGERSRM